MITEASPILNLLLAKGVGTKTLSEIVDNLVSHGLSPDDIGIEALAHELNWRSELKTSALSVRKQADELAEHLEREKICILVRGFGLYPRKLSHALGKNAPPVLFARGNLRLLDSTSVGFCGSRHASDKGIRVVAESARLLGAKSVDVVSGYAKGVDLAAHCAALEAGGTTKIVLAEGILHFRAKREIKGFLTDENHLVLSEFSPRLPWTAHNAMQRNNTIIGLSDAMIVIESGTTGGTHACAESALRLGHPLFVAEYAVPSESAEGNEQIIRKGAIPLRGDRQGRPNLTRVYEALGIATADNMGSNGTEIKRSVSESAQSWNTRKEGIDQQPTKQHIEHGMNRTLYAKRLIEVDLPIARISAHARREKSIRHGHISTLHIWWARRPLAACRAVICAALWPDPADEMCPQPFRDAASRIITQFANKVVGKGKIEGKGLMNSCSTESLKRWEEIVAAKSPLDPGDKDHQQLLRMALLDFIADFADWDNSTVPVYLETSRALTQAAHEALGGEPGTRPLVVDPFAGGGSIPLEALRVGADAFASDLNPVPVLLNKVVLEYIPKYGKRLADEVHKWGEWIKQQAEKELTQFYPKDPDGATPIAYLWARTIKCEGPSCGSDVPLMRSPWLAKKSNRSAALQLIPNRREKRVDLQIIIKQGGRWVDQANPAIVISEPRFDGTVKRGSATCPCCGYTTPVARVREQLKAQSGGANTATLLAIAMLKNDMQGRSYRLASGLDISAVEAARTELHRREGLHKGALTLVPNESFSGMEPRRIPVPQYGINTFRDLFSSRQLLSLSTLCRLVSNIPTKEFETAEMCTAVRLLLALAIDKQADLANSLCAWEPIAECPRHLFGKQAINMVWDFSEGVTTGESSGAWSVQIDRMKHILESIGCDWKMGHAQMASATAHPLPDDVADAVITDPPYYYSVPYADLADFFYVWLRRQLSADFPDLFVGEVTPKDDECVQNLPHSEVAQRQKTRAFYESAMLRSLGECRRIAKPVGIGVVVFAHSDTDAWESLLNALVSAGWAVTASWPLDTEMASRIVAQRQVTLASSVHLVCRPRENGDGTINESIGEWRDVLSELPHRIHEWMPRLTKEGVVGADAIFACLGPALEIYSRYSRVEKSNGEVATLREYLEFVWAAVATEALALIFKDADAAGLEPDARLTAMWLWTIGGGGTNGNGKKELATENNESTEDDGESEEEEGAAGTTSKVTGGFTLEFDTARKIAQGLGVHLEQCETLVEVKGDKARLLPVSERAQYLFGNGTQAAAEAGRGKKKAKQKELFAELDEAEAAEAGWTQLKGPSPGTTVLDRVHQAMILFAANRGELLKRFLVEDSVGKDARFWKLADNLNKLYPPGTEERRWVEGLLARKKGLGL